MSTHSTPCLSRSLSDFQCVVYVSPRPELWVPRTEVVGTDTGGHPGPLRLDQEVRDERGTSGPGPPPSYRSCGGRPEEHATRTTCHPRTTCTVTRLTPPESLTRSCPASPTLGTPSLSPPLPGSRPACVSPRVLSRSDTRCVQFPFEKWGRERHPSRGRDPKFGETDSPSCTSP